MNSAERKAELKKIKDDPKKICRTGIPIKYRGKIETFDAYTIPLEYLVYNQYNGRIGSMVKSYERLHQPLNPENPKDKELIEKFLWLSKVEANKNTMDSLLEDQQKQHGIVTADGVIIDGNRRASLLNRIMNSDDKKISFEKKSHCRFFIAIILPEDADKKEVLALETTYQMGEDAKVDYNPIEKYLKCKDLTEAGFEDYEIAKMMGTTRGEVIKMLSAMKLMDDYLGVYGYEGMYTQLEKREDAFLTLDAALKKYKESTASLMWDYTESDVTDLKLIAFDYIRLGFEMQPFRSIITAPSRNKEVSSFFSQKDIWEKFRDKHLDKVDSVHEKSVPEIIKIVQEKQGDLGEALKARDKDWEKKVGDTLRNNYGEGMYRLEAKRDEKMPLKLLKKACDTLDSVDITQPDFTADSEIVSKVHYLHRKVMQFKKTLNI